MRVVFLLLVIAWLWFGPDAARRDFANDEAKAARHRALVARMTGR